MLRWWTRLFDGGQAESSSQQLAAHRQKLGRRGEKLARKFLRKEGYRYLTGNFTTAQGEVDLIMVDGQTVVFVEVKTRRDEDFARGETAVNFGKQKRIESAARGFINKNNLQECPCRFDVVVVVIPEKGKKTVRHWKSAFRAKR